MKIKIERPFRLHFDVVETDEHVPSMRMQVAIDVQQFGHKFEYRANLWFDCSVWDTFVDGLSTIDTAAANLVDMGEHFVLRLSAVSGKPEISWEAKKADITGAVASTTFRSPIDDDTLVHLKHQFTQFDHWWQ